MNARIYGIVAEYERPEEIARAAAGVRREGYRRIEAFTPYPVENLAEVIGFRKTRVPPIVLAAGILGGTLGYGMQAYSTVWDYPLNVGGRPLHSWPAFVPITFELTVLFAAFGAVLGMLALNGLPRLHHPIFNTPHFAERNSSRFYLCVLAEDELYDAATLEKLLSNFRAANVWEVER
jgi:ActD protein